MKGVPRNQTETSKVGRLQKMAWRVAFSATSLNEQGTHVPKAKPACESADDLWMVAKSISHHFETMVKTITVVAIFVESTHSWVFLGAKWISQPSTVGSPARKLLQGCWRGSSDFPRASPHLDVLSFAKRLSLGWKKRNPSKTCFWLVSGKQRGPPKSKKHKKGN